MLGSESDFADAQRADIDRLRNALIAARYMVTFWANGASNLKKRRARLAEDLAKLGAIIESTAN